jgi:Flp pilus assembly protein TadG
VAVQFALAVPILITLLGVLVQATVCGLGYLALAQAAEHAAQTTRLIGGTVAAGRADATALLHQLGGHLVTNPTIQVTRGVRTTTVTIHAHARGAPLALTATATAPTERYT